MTDLTLAPETKAASGGEVGAAFSEFMSAFESFKETNDQRLVEIERRSSADVVTLDRLDRISAALDAQKARVDDLVLKGRRPALSPDAPRSDALAIAHKSAFHAYVRRGQEEGLKALEAKALSTTVGADGGYLVPTETEAAIMMRLAKVSPIRRIAGNRAVSGSSYRKPFSITGPATGWVAETAARPETTAPVLAELAFPTTELYAMPAATPALIDDAAVDIDQWIAEEVETAFAEQEGAAFVSGSGTNRPKGFLSYTAVADASWSWGNLGYIATGVAGGFPAANPSDILVDLIYSLRAGYRQNGTFVMNRKVQASIRKMKDADGNYLWTPPATPGADAMLMNFPVVDAEDMPDIASGSLSVTFGDFRRGYLVVDRAGVNVLRDPYSSKPYVLFYTTKRVGGGVQDFSAIKLLKFSAS